MHMFYDQQSGIKVTKVIRFKAHKIKMTTIVNTYAIGNLDMDALQTLDPHTVCNTNVYFFVIK